MPTWCLADAGSTTAPPGSTYSIRSKPAIAVLGRPSVPRYSSQRIVLSSRVEVLGIKACGWVLEAGHQTRRRSIEEAVEAPACVAAPHWLCILQVCARNRPITGTITSGDRDPWISFARPARAPIFFPAAPPQAPTPAADHHGINWQYYGYWTS